MIVPAFGFAVSARCPRVLVAAPAPRTCPCRAQSHAANMSLTGDLVYKAIEAGAVALAARTFTQPSAAQSPSFAATKAAQQPAKKHAAQRKGGLFGRGMPEPPPPQPSAADIVADVLSRVISGNTGEPNAQSKRKHAASGIGRKAGNSSTADAAVGSVEILAAGVGNLVGDIAKAARADKWIRLVCCITIDLIGSGSLAVPVLGDALDFATAPLCAMLVQQIFGSTMVTAGLLAEEVLPGTDAIPTATIAWLAQNSGYLAEYHGDEVDSPARNGDDAIKKDDSTCAGKAGDAKKHARRSLQLW